jgi:hypothetical protein
MSRMVRASTQVFTVVAVLTMTACGSVTRSAAPENEPSAAMSVGQSADPSVMPSVSNTASPSSSVSESPLLSVQAPVQGSSRLPAAPIIESVTAGEGSLAVRISGPSGAGPITQYLVTAAPETGGPEVTTEWPCRPWEMPCTITGLEQGAGYVVRAAAMNAYGAGTRAEGGTWVAGVLKPSPPPPDYPVLPTTLLCSPGQGGSGGLRDVYVTINNWLSEDLYIKEEGEQVSRRTKGRITSSTTGHRCTSSGNLSLNTPTYLDMDLGIGQVPVLRNGPSGPQDYQYLDLWNPWFGLPSIAVGIKDPALGNRRLYLKGNVGEGAAMSWAGKYFYATRQPDDSCAPDRICWNLVMSRMPNGVQDGMTWAWGGGGQTKGPDPIPPP